VSFKKHNSDWLYVNSEKITYRIAKWFDNKLIIARIINLSCWHEHI